MENVGSDPETKNDGTKPFGPLIPFNLLTAYRNRTSGSMIVCLDRGEMMQRPKTMRLSH